MKPEVKSIRLQNEITSESHSCQKKGKSICVVRVDSISCPQRIFFRLRSITNQQSIGDNEERPKEIRDYTKSVSVLITTHHHNLIYVAALKQTCRRDVMYGHGEF